MWVGRFPCRGQEAPQRALTELSVGQAGGSRTGDGRRATGDGRRATGDGRRATGDGRRATRTKLPWALSDQMSSANGLFMRTRKAVFISLASTVLFAAPSLAGAQRVVTRDCGDRYSSRYTDCRYEVERARAEQRAAIRERADRVRERNRWDAIVRQAKTQARSYDLAERSRQRAADRVERARVTTEQREERARERRDQLSRERRYRVRW
jgi:hypothetical protein